MLSFHSAASWEWALKGAPKYNRNTEWDWSDRNRDKDVYDYYRAQLWY
jgi:hypothetical protein